MMKQTSIVLAAALFLALPVLAIGDDSPAAQAQTPQAQTQPPAAQTQPPPAQAQPPAAQTTPPPAATPPPAQPAKQIQNMMMPGVPPAELKKLSMMKGSWTSSMHMYESPMGPETTTPSKVNYEWA